MYGLEAILALTSRLVSLFSPGLEQGVGPITFHDPIPGGGSMLLDAGNGYGEPLNVIISGTSSPAVLTDHGILNYARAIGFSKECFGIHLGTPFPANLGDGNGWVNQTIELRQDYGSSGAGTCLESLVGGNHFRVFRQNGKLANSGALFLAVSKEEVSQTIGLRPLLTVHNFDQPVSDHHDIIPDGYNIGRDSLVAGAVGKRKHRGVRYVTHAENVTGLLAPGVKGVNHGIAQDGIVTLLTVTVV